MKPLTKGEALERYSSTGGQTDMLWEGSDRRLLGAKCNPQLTPSKKTGPSVLQPQGTVFCQQPVSLDDTPAPEMRLHPWSVA